MSNDDTGWSSFAKAAGLVIGVLLILAIIGGIVGVSWWRRNGRVFLQEGQAAMEQGRADGLTMSEEGCLQKAVEGAKGIRGVGSMVQSNLRLRGCLVTAKTDLAFCEGVPKVSSIIDSTRWQREKCSAVKMEAPNCTMLSAVQEYCYSRDRRVKLDAPEKAGGKP